MPPTHQVRERDSKKGGTERGSRGKLRARDPGSQRPGTPLVPWPHPTHSLPTKAPGRGQQVMLAGLCSGPSCLASLRGGGGGTGPGGENWPGLLGPAAAAAEPSAHRQLRLVGGWFSVAATKYLRQPPEEERRVHFGGLGPPSRGGCLGPVARLSTTAGAGSEEARPSTPPGHSSMT